MKRSVVLWVTCVIVILGAIEVYHYWQERQHYYDRANRSPVLAVLSTGRGEQKSFMLPDGTQVRLNTASTLKYPATMADGDRTVYLYGEAFFDVISRSCHPFRVEASDLSIEVLGTRFCVSNYPKEITRTTVTAGKVKISCHDSVVTLLPGQGAQLDPSDGYGCNLRLNKPDTADAISWTDGIFTVSNADLPELAKLLSRTYDVDIRLEGKLSHQRFDGRFSRQEPLGQAIARLMRSSKPPVISWPNAHTMIVTVGP